MANVPKKITIPPLPNEVGDIIMANSCLTLKDYKTLYRLKPFHDSANKKIYESVTIIIPTQGLVNVKTLCLFLRTVIENPELAHHVKRLEVRFPLKEADSHPNNAELYKDLSLLLIRGTVLEHLDLLERAMSEALLIFNLDKELNEYVISNTLVLVVLSRTPNLRSLILDYENDHWRNLLASSYAPAAWKRLLRRLSKLEYFELRNLQGSVQYENFLQTILVIPSLRTLMTRDFLPYLDASHGNNHITTMDLQLTAQETSNHARNLNQLMERSPALEVLHISIPKLSTLPGYTLRQPLSHILDPVSSTLKRLTLGYVCDLTQVKTSGGWPGFLDMRSCMRLTDLKISWHYFRTSDDVDIIQYLPPALTDLRIYDIPFEAPLRVNFNWTTQCKVSSLFARFYFPKLVGTQHDAEHIFLGHVKDLGNAHRSKRLPNLDKLTMEMSLLDSAVDQQTNPILKDLAQLGLLELLKERFYPKCATYVHELGPAKFVMLNNGLDVYACLKARMDDLILRINGHESQLAFSA
ncbi:hypothetical protein FKW77_006430 [Venturia effusa]|uniref:Uncharacterized protein n=1 Tax=Venturia effusa TaxID=50376 RepID=A0A517L5K6_9PEZI|nr:hypothetical protein FKW77_006430 [Venturia effusa]